jgi:hypothetical protein
VLDGSAGETVGDGKPAVAGAGVGGTVLLPWPIGLSDVGGGGGSGNWFVLAGACVKLLVVEVPAAHALPHAKAASSATKIDVQRMTDGVASAVPSTGAAPASADEGAERR